MKPRTKSSILLILTFIAISLVDSNAQQAIQASPTKFIAYSLYNFSKFIDWPGNAVTGSFQIAVIGDKSVFQELTELAKNKKQGNNATYQINFFKNSNEYSGDNQIIYLSNMYSGKVKELSSKMVSKNILFVTEREGMTSQGSTICFITADNGSMGFEISTTNALKNQLVVHKQLEKLALKVD
jgi:hypothetical protein